ncbi:MAG TPA: hypothetical protein VK484_01070, partial [Ferruginibacter sp.]|nr:hypothetical protein [Ferruginibacter sp.]
MRALFFTKIPCLLATLIISSCHLMIGTEHTKKTYIPGIKISQTFPIIDKTGKLLKYDTSVTNIYFYKDQVLYHSTYHFDSVVQKVLLKSETKDYFFVYSKGRKDGLLYDHYSS